MLRLCLDVYVVVAYYLGAARGRTADTVAGQLVGAAFAETSRLGPIQLIVSHAMLDTLELVLRRLPVTAPLAGLACDQIEAAVGAGYIGDPPLLILGGMAAIPLHDQEDAAVLNAAFVGRRAPPLELLTPPDPPI